MGVLNAKVGLNNSGVEYDVRRHGVGVRNDNGGRFVDFCSTFHLVIGGTTIQHRTRDKVSWQHPGRIANQIDHLAISRRLRGCLENIRNRQAADIGNLRDHYLMVEMRRLRTAAIKQEDEMNHRAPTYFTRRFKTTETVALFNKS